MEGAGEGVPDRQLCVCVRVECSESVCQLLMCFVIRVDRACSPEPCADRLFGECCPPSANCGAHQSSSGPERCSVLQGIALFKITYSKLF